jgi:hypothetical protein
MYVLAQVVAVADREVVVAVQGVTLVEAQAQPPLVELQQA